MQQHRQIELGRQMVDPRQRLVVGPRCVALGQGGNVIVTREYLPSPCQSPGCSSASAEYGHRRSCRWD